MDTNTPLDTSADLNIVERLWQKRFALDASALEKAQRYLESPNDWITTDGACSYYYKFILMKTRGQIVNIIPTSWYTCYVSFSFRKFLQISLSTC